MKKVIRLNESDIQRIVKRTIKEQEEESVPTNLTPCSNDNKKRYIKYNMGLLGVAFDAKGNLILYKTKNEGRGNKFAEWWCRGNA
jgi:hypothetical protein